ncbi:MAG: phospholipase [Acidimicrobiales bacterium]
MGSGETALGPSWNGSVILDIGSDVGALVLHTSSQWLGREIVLQPDDSSRPHTHSAVRERRSPKGSTFAAVYPQLHAGHYAVEGSHQRLTITGGRVTELELSETFSETLHSHH